MNQTVKFTLFDGKGDDATSYFDKLGQQSKFSAKQLFNQIIHVEIDSPNYESRYYFLVLSFKKQFKMNVVKYNIISTQGSPFYLK